MTTREKKQLTLSCAVDNYRSGWTVVEFLAHRFKYNVVEGWETRVREARVRVNGVAVDPGHVVHRDDSVEYTIDHDEPAVDESYEVLLEDDHILAVAKSGNIPVHACGVYITHTLIARLKRDFGDSLNLGHRLDRETSGVVVLAKHKKANRVLAERFARGEVEKQYLAVVYGAVDADEFTVDAPIGKIDIRDQYPDEYAYGKANDMATYLPKRAVDMENGKPARTRFERIRSSGEFTELRVIPVQGRTNQIRVHLAHAGHPIVGDKIYALSGEVRDEMLRDGLTEQVRAALVLERHALHCESLAFDHPVTGERLSLKAPVPGDMVGIVP